MKITNSFSLFHLGNFWLAVGSLLLFFFVSSSSALAIDSGEIVLLNDTDANDQPLYVIDISGAIASPMADKLTDILQSLKPSQQLMFRLNSPGGSNSEGRKLIELIQSEVQKGRSISSSVENGSTCASMCVPIFMQGRVRYAGEGTLFMFHGSFTPYLTNVPDQVQTELMIQLFVDAGINATWLQAMRDQGVFTQPGAFWISGRELFDAHSNVITNLIPRHVVEDAWYAPPDPQLQPR